MDKFETMKPDPDHKMLYIKTKNETIEKHGSLYEAVRKAWIVAPKRARKADYVIAVIDGVCRGVFKPIVWKCLPKGDPDAGRYEFDGEEVFGKVARDYTGKLVPADKMKVPKPDTI